MYLSISTHICTYHAPIYPSAHPSIYIFIHPSIYLSTPLYIYMICSVACIHVAVPMILKFSDLCAGGDTLQLPLAVESCTSSAVWGSPCSGTSVLTASAVSSRSRGIKVPGFLCATEDTDSWIFLDRLIDFAEGHRLFSRPATWAERLRVKTVNTPAKGKPQQKI